MAIPAAAQIALALAGPLLGLFGGSRGGEEQVSGEIPPEMRALLQQALATQSRQEALVDPANFRNLGLSQAPADAVPLRAAANQLAFALLPNFVRPVNSLFPGVAPAFGMADLFGFPTPAGLEGFEFPRPNVPAGSGPNNSGGKDDPSQQQFPPDVGTTHGGIIPGIDLGERDLEEILARIRKRGERA